VEDVEKEAEGKARKITKERLLGTREAYMIVRLGPRAASKPSPAVCQSHRETLSSPVNLSIIHWPDELTSLTVGLRDHHIRIATNLYTLQS
jgi:hypothetical protein